MRKDYANTHRHADMRSWQLGDHAEDLWRCRYKGLPGQLLWHSRWQRASYTSTAHRFTPRINGPVQSDRSDRTPGGMNKSRSRAPSWATTDWR